MEFVPLTLTTNKYFEQQVFLKAVNCFELYFVLQNANSSYGLFRGLIPYGFKQRLVRLSLRRSIGHKNHNITYLKKWLPRYWFSL